MSNSTNPVSNAWNPKAKAYIRLLKRTLGVEYFSNTKSPADTKENVNSNEDTEKVSIDTQPLFTSQPMVDIIPDNKHLSQEANESIQQMEIAMKYYDSTTSSQQHYDNSTFNTVVPQQPTKKFHKLRPKSATHRKTQDVRNNNNDIHSANENPKGIFYANNNNTNINNDNMPKKKNRPTSASTHRNNNSITKIEAKLSNNGDINLHNYFTEMDKNHDNWVNFLQHNYGVGIDNNEIRTDIKSSIAPDYGFLPALHLPLVPAISQASELPPIETKTVAATKSSRPKSAQNRKSTSIKVKKVKNNITNVSSKINKEKEVVSKDPYDFSDDIYDFSNNNYKPAKKLHHKKANKNLGFDEFFLQGLM